MNYMRTIGAVGLAAVSYMYRDTLTLVAKEVITYPPLRKFVSGIGLVVAGGIGLAKSKIFTAVRQQLWGKSANQEAVPLTKTRVITAGISVGTILTGLFFAFIGGRDGFVDRDLMMIKQLTDTLDSCPESKELLDKATPISLRLAFPQEIPDSLATLEPFNRTITILRELEPTGKLAHCIDKMCAAQGIESFKEFAEQAVSGNKTFADFVFKQLATEYQASSCQYNVSTACIQSQGWDPRVSLYTQLFQGENAPWATFEKMAKAALNNTENNPFIEASKNQWIAMQQNVLNAMNPNVTTS